MRCVLGGDRRECRPKHTDSTIPPFPGEGGQPPGGEASHGGWGKKVRPRFNAEPPFQTCPDIFQKISCYLAITKNRSTRLSRPVYFDNQLGQSPALLAALTNSVLFKTYWNAWPEVNRAVTRLMLWALTSSGVRGSGPSRTAIVSTVLTVEIRRSAWTILAK
jgi:hypothetical protein